MKKPPPSERTMCVGIVHYSYGQGCSPGMDDCPRFAVREGLCSFHNREAKIPSLAEIVAARQGALHEDGFGEYQ